MKYEWIGPGVLGVGKDAVKNGDILPDKFSGRIDEFLKAKKIKSILEPEPEKEPAQETVEMPDIKKDPDPEPEKEPNSQPEPEDKPAPKKMPKAKSPKSKKVKTK